MAAAVSISIYPYPGPGRPDRSYSSRAPQHPEGKTREGTKESAPVCSHQRKRKTKEMYSLGWARTPPPLLHYPPPLLLRGHSLCSYPYGTRKVRHALLKRAICTITLADVHFVCFISANYGFLHYLFSATIGVFQNSAYWHIDGTMGYAPDPRRAQEL